MIRRAVLLIAAGLAVVVLALFAAACGGSPVIGSGDLVTEQYDFRDFTRVDVSHSFEVEIRRGDEFRVEVTVDDNLVDRLRVEQSGDAVRIGMDAGISFGTATKRAIVVLPRLEAVSLSGASKGTVTGFAGRQSLNMTISGASTMTLTDIEAGDTVLDVSGASRVSGDLLAEDVRLGASGASQIQLQGSGADAELEASGASKLTLGEFEIAVASVTLSGASNGTVNVSRTLDADLSGASSLTYMGNASVRTIQTSGASEINRSQ